MPARLVVNPSVTLGVRSKSSISFLFPNGPIRADSLKHRFGSVVKPLRFLFIQVPEDCLASRRRAEVNIGCLGSHSVEKTQFDIGSAQRSQFDARTVRAETANNPTSAQLDEGVGTAHGPVDDDLIENLGGTFMVLRPERRRRHECFGFARDAPAVPIRNGNVARVTEAAESGNTMGDAKRDIMGGHEVVESVDGADGSLGFQGGQSVHFCPEVDRVAKFSFGNEAKPLMAFSENEGESFFVQGVAIAFEQNVANIFALDRKTAGLGCEMSANG